MEVSWRKSRGFGAAAAAVGGRRLEAAMFMRWRPIDEAHKEGITIWSDVSISNTFSFGSSAATNHRVPRIVLAWTATKFLKQIGH